MDTKEIVFLEDRTVTAPDGGEDIVFEKGQKCNLPLPSCERWIRRGIAKYASEVLREEKLAEKDKELKAREEKLVTAAAAEKGNKPSAKG